MTERETFTAILDRINTAAEALKQASIEREAFVLEYYRTRGIYEGASVYYHGQVCTIARVSTRGVSWPLPEHPSISVYRLKKNGTPYKIPTHVWGTWKVIPEKTS